MGLANHSGLLMGPYCDRKVTPRIIGLSRPIVQIDGEACYTAVGSSYPGRAQAAKGAGVHILKGIVSWVKIVVRQIV